MVVVRPEDPLLAARAAVLHDLEACGLADAGTVSLLEEAISQRRWWVEQWPDGRPYAAGLVAQDVQDFVLDRVGRWPVCAACPNGAVHELRIQPELGADPHWVCEQSGVTVAPLGCL